MIEIRYHQLEAIEVYNDLSVQVVGALLKSWLIFTVCHPNAGLMKSGLLDCHAHLPLGFTFSILFECVTVVFIHCHCTFVFSPTSCRVKVGKKSINALSLKWLLELIPDGLYAFSCQCASLPPGHSTALPQTAKLTTTVEFQDCDFHESQKKAIPRRDSQPRLDHYLNISTTLTKSIDPIFTRGNRVF